MDRGVAGIMRNQASRGILWKLMFALLAIAGFLALSGGAASAVGPSANVVIIGGTTLDTGNGCSGYGTYANTMGATSGGCLPLNPAADPALAAFTFAPMAPAAVSAASLAPFDTAVLNMASSGMGCNTGNLSAQAKTDLNAFVADGNKLIIYDSECGSVDYSWLTYPFTTANPGALGATGSLVIVEENSLSTNAAGPYFIDAAHLSTSTDAVGDSNVMTTLDPNWCVDMSATNAIGFTGPNHTYARAGNVGSVGLFIYNGMDQDYQGYGLNDPVMREVWIQELQQPFNPDNLPCGVSVVGITLKPQIDANPLGTTHTVTANVTDLLGQPVAGVQVTFNVVAGPNAGDTGTDTTDAAGNAQFTYTGDGGEGTDLITASFTNAAGAVITSNTVKKIWDGTDPTCALTAVNPGPPTSIEITVQDALSGLAAVNVTVANNATVNVPAFPVGTTSPVVVTATKINQSQGAQVALEVVDAAGNVYECDPVLTLEVRDTGKPETSVFNNVPQAESLVTVTNGDPGVSTLDVVVNGHKFKANLGDGESTVLDVSSAMVAGNNNTIELTAKGKPGGEVTVLIADSAGA